MSNSPLSPRREAQQKRSRKKVEQILDATMDMLSEGPADQITTNKIAEKAGISVGTLYQFFPNKEAIFYELFRDWLSRTLAALDDIRDGLAPDASKEDCIAVFLDALTEPELNSQKNWKLRWAMSTSPQLLALEAEHKREVLSRIHDLQSRLGQSPPAKVIPDFMLLQNELTIACLFSLSRLQHSPNRDQLHDLCKRLLGVIYDYPAWTALGDETGGETEP
ncbi:TetR/AcrR family transcriptional regulator [uncultured Roseobacter sp.]|uniref:TetR/AcrR family transcriptional regulator n=1 Tax=uncultured Roseobacter sp. TaxID=114847 RepID=UPI00261E56A5|nr:TetR/AcrR family transcriptional regulator [uncultured Roseobacter sp.]